MAAMRAELLVCAGRGPEAVLASQEATRLDERSAAAWRARGRALLVMGQGREAVDAFKRSLEIHEDRDAHLDLARVLVSLGRAEEAVSHVRLAIDLGAPVRTLLAQVLLELQKPEKALAACKAALAGGEAPDSVWFTMSQAREALGDRKGALRALDAAIGADPGRPEYWVERGRLFLESDRPAKAVRALDSALALNASHRQAWRYRGKALEALGRPEEARESFDRARRAGAADK